MRLLAILVELMMLLGVFVGSFGLCLLVVRHFDAVLLYGLLLHLGLLCVRHNTSGSLDS